MPIYEFFCEPCELAFEDLKALNDFNANCPVCGTPAQKREVSNIAVVVKGGNKRTIDHIIGEDADKKWQKIHEDKSERDKKNFGGAPEADVKAKDAQRIGKLVEKQNNAYSELDKAKKDAGITKNDELKHALGLNK